MVIATHLSPSTRLEEPWQRGLCLDAPLEDEGAEARLRDRDDRLPARLRAPRLQTVVLPRLEVEGEEIAHRLLTSPRVTSLLARVVSVHRTVGQTGLEIAEVASGRRLPFLHGVGPGDPPAAQRRGLEETVGDGGGGRALPLSSEGPRVIASHRVVGLAGGA